MQGFLDDVCKVVDCGPVNPGGTCYEPNTLRSHTSFVLNLNYKKNNVCPQDIGAYTDTDPCK
ncbi:hypothetical protein ACJIZ3_021160 [Penstemon smallii]|uniref:X8 domain-containing protein n=1 Tax=Penstemon smallii TaxID=265156 RepID=A0ABD3SL83_9LAMI